MGVSENRGVLIIRILLRRVRYQGPLFSETPILRVYHESSRAQPPPVAQALASKSSRLQWGNIGYEGTRTMGLWINIAHEGTLTT